MILVNIIILPTVWAKIARKKLYGLNLLPYKGNADAQFFSALFTETASGMRNMWISRFAG